MQISEFILAIIGGGVLGTIISVYAGRAKNSAEIQKLFAEADKIRIESQNDLQKQIDELRTKNTILFEERAKADARSYALSIEVEKLQRMIVDKNAEVSTLRKIIDSYGKDLKEVKKQTGQLPPAPPR